MKCPHCEQELATQSIDGLELDLCAKCGGIWFDPSELSDAQKKADEDLAWMHLDIWKQAEKFQLAPGRRCPRCSKGMCSMKYGDTGVQVEACPGCRGVWLDRDDFPRIVAALEHEVAEMSSGELLAASLKEAVDIFAHPTKLIHEWADLRCLLSLLGRRLMIENPALARRISEAPGGTPFS